MEAQGVRDETHGALPAKSVLCYLWLLMFLWSYDKYSYITQDESVHFDFRRLMEICHQSNHTKNLRLIYYPSQDSPKSVFSCARQESSSKSRRRSITMTGSFRIK